jgi:hypothetical protein
MACSHRVSVAVGGIDRAKTRNCVLFQIHQELCSTPENYGSARDPSRAGRQQSSEEQVAAATSGASGMYACCGMKHRCPFDSSMHPSPKRHQPASAFNSVLLPSPDEPLSQTVSPLPIARSAGRRTCGP